MKDFREFTPKYALTIDFETYYSTEYTLSKLTTAEYIRDPRFEVIGVGMKLDDSPPIWVSPVTFKKFVANFPWHEAAVLAHHAHFDGGILAHHFGVTPGIWFDTLSMARALHGTTVGGSLKKLMAYYGVGEKGDEIVKALGKRAFDFTPEGWARYGEYCKNDVFGCHAIFSQMCQRGFPESEMWLIDTTLRMFTEPLFQLDKPLVEQAILSERDRKAELLRWAAKDKSILMSNEKFAAALIDAGAIPPRKTSPRTGKETWAFAKTDVGMQELLESPIDNVRWLAEARVGVKSTINETRSERFLKVGRSGPVPVYLNYSAAHTFRWGGGDKMNMQNLERTSKTDPEKGKLRKALQAPKGHVVVAVDSAQIEARVLAWLAGHDALVEAFRENRDIYSEFATGIYGRPVDRKKNPDDFIPGFVGKVCILGLGFGMGWYKFAETMLKGALGGPPVVFGEELLPGLAFSEPSKLRRVEEMPSRLPFAKRLIHCSVAEIIVRKYRMANAPVTQFWKTAETALNCMSAETPWVFGPLRVEGHGIVLPSGLIMRYPDLKHEGDGFSYLGGRGKGERVRAYGGSVTENIVQALARQVVAEQMQAIRAMGYKIATMTHDEVVLVVPEKDGDQALADAIGAMKAPPAWAQDLPLNAEGGIGANYGECK